MSDVYLAYDEHLRRKVAVKVVDEACVSQGIQQAESVKRFQQEIRVLGTLTHPHILPVLDYGTRGSWHFLVMPYMEQGTLAERLLKGPLSLKATTDMLRQLLNALQYAHDQGLIHRDIKPSNILVQDSLVYLTDFGLAKFLRDPRRITQNGYVMGTPEYMAPELAYVPASVCSDIYAVGILLYQILTGKVPFRGSSPFVICLKHMQELPLRPSLLNGSIPIPVEQVILRALEKQPTQRYLTARALLQAYEQALAVPVSTTSLNAQSLPDLDKTVLVLPSPSGTAQRHAVASSMQGLVRAGPAQAIVPPMQGLVRAGPAQAIVPSMQGLVGIGPAQAIVPTRPLSHGPRLALITLVLLVALLGTPFVENFLVANLAGPVSTFVRQMYPGEDVAPRELPGQQFDGASGPQFEGHHQGHHRRGHRHQDGE